MSHKLIKSKYSNCPACEIELGEPGSRLEYIKCHTQSFFPVIENFKKEIIGFEYHCWRCHFNWFEKIEVEK